MRAPLDAEVLSAPFRCACEDPWHVHDIASRVPSGPPTARSLDTNDLRNELLSEVYRMPVTAPPQRPRPSADSVQDVFQTTTHFGE